MRGLAIFLMSFSWGAIVLADAIPRMRDSFVRLTESPSPQRYRSVPPRLLRLIWEELPQGFSLDQLLRHPEARRAADRAALLRHVRALVRSGALRRERRLVDPRTSEYRVRVLDPGDRPIRGKKAEALAAFVRAHPGTPRAQALLAGFSSAVIARAVEEGAIRERWVRPATSRSIETSEGGVVPTAEQERTLHWISEALDARRFAAALLYGVTASGKTFVYVGETDYVATLPKSLVLRFGQTFGIRVLTPSAPRVSVAVKLAWHERTQHDAAMRAFRDLVANAVRASRKATQRSPANRKS